MGSADAVPSTWIAMSLADQPSIAALHAQTMSMLMLVHFADGDRVATWTRFGDDSAQRTVVYSDRWGQA